MTWSGRPDLGLKSVKGPWIATGAAKAALCLLRPARDTRRPSERDLNRLLDVTAVVARRLGSHRMGFVSFASDNVAVLEGTITNRGN